MLTRTARGDTAATLVLAVATLAAAGSSGTLPVC